MKSTKKNVKKNKLGPEHIAMHLKHVERLMKAHGMPESHIKKHLSAVAGGVAFNGPVTTTSLDVVDNSKSSIDQQSLSTTTSHVNSNTISTSMNISVI